MALSWSGQSLQALLATVLGTLGMLGTLGSDFRWEWDPLQATAAVSLR